MATSTAPASLQGGSWVQTGPLTFNRPLAASNTFQQISEVPALTIPYAGVWWVSYNAYTGMNVRAGGALGIRTALFNKGVQIPGSEAVSNLATAADVGIQTTAAHTFLHTFAAQDVVTLQATAYGNGEAAFIASDDNARTAVMAHWVSPGF